MPAHGFGVLLQHLDGHVAGLFDRRDAGLRDTDAPRELALGQSRLLAQGGEPGGETELVFDLGDPLRRTGPIEHLLPHFFTLIVVPSSSERASASVTP